MKLFGFAELMCAAHTYSNGSSTCLASLSVLFIAILKSHSNCVILSHCDVNVHFPDEK